MSTNKSSYTVQEVIAEKAQLEKDLEDFIDSKIRKFQEKFSELNIREVYFEVERISTIGRFLTSVTKVELEIML